MAIEVISQEEYTYENSEGEKFEIKDEEKTSYKLRFLSSIKEKKHSEASEALVEYVMKNCKIYTTKEDNKSEMWVYKEGIYQPNGKSEVKERLRDLLGSHFSMFYFNQVISKIEADTYIETDNFFKLQNKDEVPVQNGILNIFTKKITPFTPEKIFFNKLPVYYDPNAKCEMIDKFLGDVLAEENDKLIFYEIGGFGLMKEYRFEKAFMFHGSGRNGKGKTIDLLRRTIGAYNCSSLTMKSLVPESFQISELFGKLLNLAGDLDRSDLKDTGMFKSLTGRDLVSGKRKFLRDIVFENYAKFIFACNELPVVYDTSKGFWERWILLDFPYYFADKEEYERTTENERKNWKIKDADVLEKITTPGELSGLLNKFLEGLDRLIQNKKFSSTQGSEDIKSIWIRSANSVIAFCMDKIEEDPESNISKKELRKKYSAYCKEHKVPTKSDVVIKRVLQDMFGSYDEEKKVGEGLFQTERFWDGIKWKN